MSKTDLARVLGVNMTTIGRWESETDPAFPTFDKAVELARALRVSLDVLAYGEPSVYERALAQARREFGDQLELLRQELRREHGEQSPPSAGRAGSSRQRE